MATSTRRTEIIAQAARLFRKKGYAATSIRDIAEEVGMKSASLYNHINQKKDILEELLLSLADLYTKGIEDIAHSPLTSIEKLERIVAEQIRITLAQPDAVALIPSDWVHLEDTPRAHFLKQRDTYDGLFRKIFTQAIEDGYLKEVDVDIAAFSILSTLRWLYSWVAKNKSVNPVVLEVELKQNLLGGLRKV